jgi:hypothetical protein
MGYTIDPNRFSRDQFFSESQFESYRMVAAHTVDKLCTDCGGDFRCFIRDILESHLKIEPPDLACNRSPSVRPQGVTSNIF